jgi:hypothetical protein
MLINLRQIGRPGRCTDERIASERRFDEWDDRKIAETEGRKSQDPLLLNRKNARQTPQKPMLTKSFLPKVPSSRFIFIRPLKCFMKATFAGAIHFHLLHSIATRNCPKLEKTIFIGVIPTRFDFLHLLKCFVKSAFAGARRLPQFSPITTRNCHKLKKGAFYGIVLL